MTFEDLKLSNQLVEVLNNLGLSEPTEIQKLGIPYILQGKDIVGRSETGSGKTFAFALPIVQNIKKTGSVDCLGCYSNLCRFIPRYCILSDVIGNGIVSLISLSELSLLLFSCSTVSNSLSPYGLQHARLSYHSQSSVVCSNSCPLSQ